MSESKKPLHLKSVDVKNVRGIREVKITVEPDKALMIISGENGAGKSSLVDAIWGPLAKKEAGIEELRQGENEGHVELDVDEFVVRMELKRSKSGVVSREIKVSLKDEAFAGMKFSTPPRKLLDNLVSKFLPDVGAFLNLNTPAKADALRKAFGIPILKKDPEFLALEEKRRDVKKDLARLEAQTQAILDHKDAPDEEESVAALTDELQKANEHNAANAQTRSNAESAKSKMEDYAARISDQDAEVQRLQDALMAASKTLEEMQDTYDAASLKTAAIVERAASLKDMDTSSLTEAISNAEATNRMVREKKQKAIIRDEWKEKEAERAQSEIDIEAMRKAVADKTAEALKDLNLGVKLEMDDDGDVTIDGLPWDNANTATQLRIALGIALQENPRLKVFRLSRGEMFTDASLAIIEEMAKEHDALVLMEKPRSEDEEKAKKAFKATIFLRDGEVVEL